jgi:hypothetical protein
MCRVKCELICPSGSGFRAGSAFERYGNAEKCLRQNTNFASCVKLLGPIQPVGVKDSTSVFRKNMIWLSYLAAEQEGRFAIVTDVGSGMRWTRRRRRRAR